VIWPFKKKERVDVDELVKWAEDLGLMPGGFKSVHLVLAGGGVRLFALMLAVYVLHLAGYIFLSFTGTSAGAIVSAVLARHYAASDSKEDRGKAIIKSMKIALSMDIPKFLDPQWTFWRLAYKLVGIIKGKKLLRKFKKELPDTFADLRSPCTLATFRVDLVDPRTWMLDSGPLPLAVRASMAIPYVFSPVVYNGMQLVDGGWQMNLPIPRGGENVVALTFSTGDNDDVEEVKNNIELGFKLIEGAIAEGMRRAADSAPLAKIIDLDTSLTTLDFFADAEKKKRGMIEAGDSVAQWLKKEGAA
jgi:predicted acylesterase/phospholipase RssA